MKSAALFLSGLSAMLAGAFIRSCQPDIPAELLMSWCGPAPHGAISVLHQHCAGCVTMYAGLAAILVSPLLALPRRRRQRAGK